MDRRLGRAVGSVSGGVLVPPEPETAPVSAMPVALLSVNFLSIAMLFRRQSPWKSTKRWDCLRRLLEDLQFGALSRLQNDPVPLLTYFFRYGWIRRREGF